MTNTTESLRLVRFLMVLSSFNILFLLWAFTGVEAISNFNITINGMSFSYNTIFRLVCILFIILPIIILLLREWSARKDKDFRIMKIGRAEDHRDYLLVYLLAVLMPLWAANMTSIESFEATIVALLFIIFLFYNLNLHYINAIYAFRGYKIFTVQPPTSANPFSGKHSFIVLSKRDYFEDSDEIKLCRLSDNVYIEMER